jgi:pimeloyl-ACP methyl ester carboxylesterase
MAKASPVHLSRRGAFGAAAAGAALTAATFSETSSVWAQTRNKATFVLVHPAWFGGWCWKKITPLLRARGYEVFTPTLTGLGERAHLARPEIGLNIHIEDVANLLKYEDLSDVILVGNSSAGMVITGVADQAPERIAHIVYLDAFVPQDGQTMLDLIPPDRRPPMEMLVQNEGHGWLLPLGALRMRQTSAGRCLVSVRRPSDISRSRCTARMRLPRSYRAPTFAVCSGQMRFSTAMPKLRDKRQDGGTANSRLPTSHILRIRTKWPTYSSKRLDDSSRF